MFELHHTFVIFCSVMTVLASATLVNNKHMPRSGTALPSATNTFGLWVFVVFGGAGRRWSTEIVV